LLNNNTPISKLSFPLCYKVSLCKTVRMKMSSVYMLMFMQIKLIFMGKVFKDLFWNRGTRLLGNSILLLTRLHLVTISHISFILCQSIVLVNRTWKHNYVLITHQLQHFTTHAFFAIQHWKLATSIFCPPYYWLNKRTRHFIIATMNPCLRAMTQSNNISWDSSNFSLPSKTELWERANWFWDFH